MGSGCGSVGRAVACNTRGLRFDSSHRQNFIEHLFIINCIEKTKINKKRPGMAHFLKKINRFMYYKSYWLLYHLQLDRFTPVLQSFSWGLLHTTLLCTGKLQICTLHPNSDSEVLHKLETLLLWIMKKKVFPMQHALGVQVLHQRGWKN